MTVRPLLALWRQLVAPPPPTRPARSRHAAARRAVLSGAIAFVLATAGYAAALDAYLPLVRFPEHGYRLAAMRRLQAQEPDRPLVVVIGSSRTQMAIDPSAMGFAAEPGSPVVFNYGLAGALPAHLPVGLRRLRDEGVKPAAVVIEIFPGLLYFDDDGHALYAEEGRALTAAELLRLGPETRTQVARRWVAARCNVWSRFRRNLQQHAIPRWLPALEVLRYDLVMAPDRFGFKPFPTDCVSDEQRKWRTEAARSYRDVCHFLRVSTQAETAFRELVASCRADGVPIAFYLSPESALFHDWYTPESRAELAALVRRLTDELGAPVFDVSGGWAEEEFIDGHHMLAAGAARFSRHFADAHLRPWLAAALPNERK